MNILYLCDEYPPGKNGGIGTAVQLLARQMVQLGHTVLVAGFYDWGYGGADEFIDEGVKVYRFRRKLPPYLFRDPESIVTKGIVKALNMSGVLQWDIAVSLRRYGRFVNDLIERHRVDIIEMPDYTDYVRFVNKVIEMPPFNAPVVLKMHGCRTYILSENNMDVPKNVWQIEHNRLKAADYVSSVSAYNAAVTAKYLNYHGDIKVMHNGVKLQGHLTAGKHAYNVVFSGSLSVNKGVPQLMKAWNTVINEMPEARLWVFGKGPIDKMTAYLNEDAIDSVYFKGHVTKNELFGQFASAQVAVFPSYAESFALAPMETMAMGIATIFTSRTSGPELIQHNENGLLVDPDDVPAIARHIIYLLKHPAEQERLGKAGKARIENEFTIDKIALGHADYYKSVLAQRIFNDEQR